MTIEVRVHPTPWKATFPLDQVVRLGRDRSNDVVVGRERVHGRATVSKVHAHVQWDGTRWSTLNVSDKTGLLSVYEPGYEEVPLEPGRPWVPVRHRWSLSFGRPDHLFTVVFSTGDHHGPGVAALGSDGLHTLEPDSAMSEEDEPTAALDSMVSPAFTPLEIDALLAYYSAFLLLPRPAVLAPRSHDEAARRLGRSKDSTRKAIARANEKIGSVAGAPAIASGRNVSEEIGRWLARAGLIDLEHHLEHHLEHRS
ncbi:MAG: hypothetical protein HYX32_10640 [Actinobacteria bacterium]|nr:hypothetical protein [Actinomycetota bacterium]